MYVGMFTQGATVRFLHQSRNGSNVPTDADTAPTYRVYELPSETPLTTGTSAAFDASNTDGVYLVSFTAAGGSGYDKGTTYTVRVLETVSSTQHAATYTFTVV